MKSDLVPRWTPFSKNGLMKSSPIKLGGCSSLMSILPMFFFLKNGWLEDETFLWGFGLFSGVYVPYQGVFPPWNFLQKSPKIQVFCPKRTSLSSKHQFSGAFAVIFRECNYILSLEGGFIFFFTPIWGRFPVWLIFFQMGGSTTNQRSMYPFGNYTIHGSYGYNYIYIL